MEVQELIKYVRDVNRTFEEFEGLVDDLIAQNSELVAYVVENWESVLTPGFLTKFLKIRLKTSAHRKFSAKCLRGIMSVNSNFVMNVTTVRTWRRQAESVVVTFTDDEIRQLYNTILALEHDADFVNPLRQKSEFHFRYFLTKIPFVRRQRALYEGEPLERGLLEYPLLTGLAMDAQPQVNARLTAAALLGAPV